MELKGAGFIITGAASGLGAATARQFHAAGASVLLADLNTERGQALATELGDRAQFARVDVTSEADCKAAVAAAQQAFGQLHGVVNCAGIVVGEKVVGKQGPHALDSFARCIQINLVGAFNMMRIAAAAMSEQQGNADGERGIIINTASVAAYDGQIGQCAYAASKGGLVSLTLPAARELARFGIRVMTVAPGIFETPMMDSLPAEVQQTLGKSVPFPSRLGRPQEFAQLCQHIVENAMLNGETIRLDGAIRLAPK